MNGKFMAVSHIQCSKRRRDPTFSLLLHWLLDYSAKFYMDDCPILGYFGDNSFLDTDGNFRKRVELSVSDKFTICLK